MTKNMDEKAHFMMALTQLEAALMCVIEVAEDAIDTIAVERTALIEKCVEERKNGRINT